ncbi:hypothetical protein TPY_2193 [Sulfobacillus acidophilus TPY]|nr:hypothetical protein TPY_2193 [Sulfobacillus acidophilus TPY]
MATAIRRTGFFMIDHLLELEDGPSSRGSYRQDIAASPPSKPLPTN